MKKYDFQTVGPLWVSLFSRIFLERLMLRGTQWVFGRADSYYSDRKITKIESTVRCGRADHPSPPLPAPPRPSPPRPAPQRGRHREKERLDRCAAARPETGLPAIFVWIFCRYYSTGLIQKIILLWYIMRRSIWCVKMKKLKVVALTENIYCLIEYNI